MDLKANMGLKITALSLAVLAWMYVHQQPEASTQVTVPLVVSGLPQELVPISAPPASVTLTLVGSQFRINNLNTSDVALELGLSSRPLRQGENTISLSREMVRVPSDVVVHQIVPSVFKLNLEDRKVEELSVQPNVYGEPASGYQLGELTIRPPRLKVSGPSSLVSRIASLSTEPINVQGDRADKVLRVSVELPPLDGQQDLVTLISPDNMVSVTIPIRPLLSELALSAIPIRVKGHDQARVEPSTVTVELRGPQAKLAGIEAGDLVVELDPQGQTGDNLSFTASDLIVRAVDEDALDLAGVEWIVTDPAKLSVTLPGDKAS